MGSNETKQLNLPHPVFSGIFKNFLSLEKIFPCIDPEIKLSFKSPKQIDQNYHLYSIPLFNEYILLAENQSISNELNFNSLSKKSKASLFNPFFEKFMPHEESNTVLYQGKVNNVFVTSHFKSITLTCLITCMKIH